MNIHKLISQINNEELTAYIHKLEKEAAEKEKWKRDFLHLSSWTVTKGADDGANGVSTTNTKQEG